MSIAKGFDQAVYEANSIGCTSMQIFTKSNRQWAAKKIAPQKIENFHHAIITSLMGPVIAHCSYLINIGSANSEIEQKSVSALIDELQRCQLLQIPFLVVHPGSHLGQSVEQCLDKVVRNLNIIINESSQVTIILLELMSGQGSTICSSFEQLAYVYQQIQDKERVRICFDTCHAWAAGYDFSSLKKYELMWQQFDDAIGINKIKVIHMNDSKTICGSLIDRHEAIGKGKIGIPAFGYIMNDNRFFDVPKIVETPKKSIKDDIHNMNILKEILTDSTRKKLNIQ